MNPESLLQIPLVARAFSDRRFKPTPRAIDAAWSYQGHTTASVIGFNPFSGRFYYGARSLVARWLGRKSGSARPLNAGDRLLREVLFCVHDYLHAWSYGVLRSIDPALGAGHAPITQRNVEDLAFVHLATEAAAVAGLDYWYLATVDLDEVCRLGTTVGGLATRYHERFLPEYRRARPGLVVQQVEFFSELAVFYANGVLLGFPQRKLIESPRSWEWLRHELEYGVRQRRYIRHWLRHLGGLAPIADADAERPVPHEGRRRRAMLVELGRALWALVKEGRETIAPTMLKDRDAWSSARRPGSEGARASNALDPRLLNLNVLSREEQSDIERQSGGTPLFDVVMDQRLSRCVFDRFDRAKLPLLTAVRQRRDPAALAALLDGAPQVPSSGIEPRDLMLFN